MKFFSHPFPGRTFGVVGLIALVFVAYFSQSSKKGSTQESSVMAAATKATSASSAISKGAVIFLHGLGDAGSSWSWMAKQYAKSLPSVQFTFLDAPIQPVTLNGGRAMPSWFDLDDLPVTSRTPDDVEGFNESTLRIHKVIDAAVASGIEPGRIVLGGFSQGAALSLYAGLRYPKPLGGLILLSGWTAAKSSFPGCMPEAVAVAKPRVYSAHGTRDDKVLYELGKATADMLKGAEFDVRWRPFQGYHELVDEEVDDIGAFLREVMNREAQS